MPLLQSEVAVYETLPSDLRSGGPLYRYVPIIHLLRFFLTRNQTLEKLLGSQSLVSAIGTACTLRSASVVSIGLLLLWTLSPLGGQSSLRLIYQTNSTISERGSVYYSDPAAPLDLDEAGNWLKMVPTILTASLSTSMETKFRPVDSWSHPKVPRLDAIEQQALEDPFSEGGWIDVDPTLNHTYSSWTGINVQNLRRTEKAEFQVKYNYMYLDCQNPYTDTPETILASLASNWTIVPPLVYASPDAKAINTLQNISNLGASAIPEVKILSFLLRAAYQSNNTHNLTNMTAPQFQFTRQPISFLYGSLYSERPDPDDTEIQEVFQMYTCSPHVVTVDAQIECQGGDCSVSRLRHAPGRSSSSLEEPCDTGPAYRLVCMTSATSAVRLFLRYFPAMVASYMTPARVPGPFDDWLTGINEPYEAVLNRTREQISDQEKSSRLTTLLNTYWQGSVWGFQITSAGLFERPKYLDLGQAALFLPDRWMNVSEATFSHSVLVYRAEVGWIISLLLITVILLLIGLANVVISFMTIAPDLFYYASSLARENPYTETPDGGTALDGAERSRLLKAMKVQIADVSPEDRVGYVVMKSVADGDYQTGRLKKGRLYW